MNNRLTAILPDILAEQKLQEAYMLKLNIGEKIQKYRQARGVSLRELAEMSGLTASMLSQLENNSVNPSINTLRTLSEVLEFPLYTLFQEDASLEEQLIVRKGNYQVMGRLGKEVTYSLLTPDLRGMIEFVMMDIPPRTSTADKDRYHNGEETAYVLEGDVDITLDGNVYTLHEGDAVKIPMGVTHSWMNNSDKMVHVIFAITPPSF